MLNKIKIEYSYLDDYWGDTGSTRCMSRNFDNIAKAADFIQSLTVNKKSLKMFINGQEFNWPENTGDEETLRKHLEYCLDFVEAFYGSDRAD